MIQLNTSVTDSAKPAEVRPPLDIKPVASIKAEPKASPSEESRVLISANSGRVPYSQQLAKINDFVKSVDSSLEFSVDDESGTRIVKIMNKDTNEVIRQIPSEDIVRIHQMVVAAQEKLSAGANVPAPDNESMVSGILLSTSA